MKKQSTASFLILFILLCITNWLFGCRDILPTTNPLVVDRTPSSFPNKFVATQSVQPIITPIPSLMPTLHLTETPFSTLTPLQRHAKILNLMADTSDCRLPCWWGIQPGQTTWKKAKSLLEPIASEIDYGLYGDFFSSYAVFQPSPSEISSSYISLEFSGQGKENIQVIYISGIEYDSSLFLPNFLNSYGPPDEIWVNTFSSWTTIDGKPPFALFLFYSKRGILARYDTDAVIKGKTIYACLNEITSIKLWNLNRTISFHEAAGDFDGDKLPPSEAFGLSEKEFYEQYKNSEYPCFETPKMKWSGIDGSTPAPYL